MNKALSKKLEQAARKHAKSTTLGSKDSFTKGGEFINKNSEKQYTEKDMLQMLTEGVLHFLHAHDKTISGQTIKTYFKNYMKKH